jgi:hypothetical protein
MEFDNKLEPTAEQTKAINYTGHLQVLEQTRSGNIIVCDMLNPYKPIYIITQDGRFNEVYNFYHLR